MPQKQIYLSNNDVIYFEQLQHYAQQKGVSVSSIIIEAIKAYMVLGKEASGKEEYTIQTIEYGSYFPQPSKVMRLKFYGRLLAACSVKRDQAGVDYWKIFHTRRCNFLLWRRFCMQANFTDAEGFNQAQPDIKEEDFAEYRVVADLPGEDNSAIGDMHIPVKLLRKACEELEIPWLKE